MEGQNSNLFSLKVYHGGRFSKLPGRQYVGGKISFVDMIDFDEFSLHEVNSMIQEIGYPKDEEFCYYFRDSNRDLDFGLKALRNDMDVIELLKYVPNNKIIELFTSTSSQNDVFGDSIRHLTLERNQNVGDQGIDCTVANNTNVEEDDMVDDAYDVKTDFEATNFENIDLIVDKENDIVDVQVDMTHFRSVVNSNLELSDEEVNDLEYDEVDHDDFDSLSDEDNDPLLKRNIKKLRKMNNKKMKDIGHNKRTCNGQRQNG
ncbi:hypothetical protein R6Q59_027123 [Mikania micrantha]